MKAKTCMTEIWRPDTGCIQKIKAKHPRIDLEYYIEEMRDHFLGNGKPMKCWDATFRNWIRRAPNFSPIVTCRRAVMHEKPAADVVEIGTLHACRARGIDTTGKTEGQLCAAIFDHDHKFHKKEEV